MAKVPPSPPASLLAAFADVSGSAQAGGDDFVPGPRLQVKPLAGPERETRLAALLGEHFRMVWRALRRLGVAPGNVDDAAQEVFIIASNKLELIEPGQEKRFLYGVALRVAANARRARAARPESAEPELVADAREPGPSPEALLDRKRARALLDAVLDTLPDELRTAFVLVELEGCTGPELAELLEVPLGTAASRTRRAREAFHRAVSELRARLESGGQP
jgi:RNA polymerase sigma-70 factor (ECF subfamily)